MNRNNVSNMIYQDAFDYSSVGIGIMDSNGKFIDANSKWLNMFGYTHGEIIGLKIDEITHENDYLKSKYFLDNLIKGDIEDYSIQKKYRKKNGEIFIGELCVKRRLWDDKSDFNIIGIITDVSDTIEYRNKLKQMNIDLKVERNYRKKLIKKQKRLFEILSTLKSRTSYGDIYNIINGSLGDIVGNKGTLLIIESDVAEDNVYIGDNRLHKDKDIIDIYNLYPERFVYKIKGDNYYNYRIMNHNKNFGSILIKKRKPIDEDESALLDVLVNHLSIVIQDIQMRNAQQLKIHKLKDLTNLFNKTSKCRSKEGIIEVFREFSWFYSVEFQDEVVASGDKKLFYCKKNDQFKCYGSLNIDGKDSLWVVFSKITDFTEIDREIVKLIIEHLCSIFELNNLISSSEEKALIDPLTGIWNRRYMISVLEKNSRCGEIASLVLVDLGNFKIVNDMYGHNVGDEVLKFVAEIISCNLRGSDFVCRFGGDEFLVFLPDTVLGVAEKIMERLYKKIIIETEKKYSFPIHADYGSVSVSGTRDKVMDTIKKADEKMYYNKRNRKRLELEV